MSEASGCRRCLCKREKRAQAAPLYRLSVHTAQHPPTHFPLPVSLLLSPETPLSAYFSLPPRSHPPSHLLLKLRDVLWLRLQLDALGRKLAALAGLGTRRRVTACDADWKRRGRPDRDIQEAEGCVVPGVGAQWVSRRLG